MLTGFRQQLTEPKMAQLVLRIIAGHFPELSDAVLKLTHEAPLSPYIESSGG
jgi:hypothetical protein